MKNKSSFLPVLILCTSLLTLSCKKNTDATNQNTASNFNAVGTWTIAAYSQRTEDKTSMFNGYVFTFQNGGTAQAEKGGTITTGTWTYTPSAVGYYGGPPSKASFTLNFGASTSLSRLSRTWNIDDTKTSASSLSLVNPEPAEQEVITFSKQ
jgi:hypothetical protein